MIFNCTACPNLCVNILRWILFVLNLLFWLLGLGLIGVSLWLRYDPDVVEHVRRNTDPHHLDEYFITLFVLMGIGFVMAVLGFFGCVGSLRRSPCLLGTFFALLTMLVLCELLACILIFIYRKDARLYVEDSMRDVIMTRYGSTNARNLTQMVDRVQESLNCCGVRNYGDWLNSKFSAGLTSNPEIESVDSSFGMQDSNQGTFDFMGGLDEPVGVVPRSCCNEEGIKTYKNCGLSFNNGPLFTYEPFLNTKGCADVIYFRVWGRLDIILGVLGSIILLQLISLVLSLIVSCCSRQYKPIPQKPLRY